MRFRAFSGTQIGEPDVTTSVPIDAFETALERMRTTEDSTHDIITDYLKELGA